MAFEITHDLTDITLDDALREIDGLMISLAPSNAYWAKVKAAALKSKAQEEKIEELQLEIGILQNSIQFGE